MSAFTAAESAACKCLIALALPEDLGEVGDLTSEAIMPLGLRGSALFTARAHGVVAGLPAVALVLERVDSDLAFEPFVADGTTVRPGDRLARVSGSVLSLLQAERTALNFLQHLSGIATQTRRYVDAVAGLPVQILDTRKTLPGWRLLEKYAVRCGGGANHRVGLHDAFLIKDNHLAPFGGGPDAVVRALEAARRFERVCPGKFLEVEVDDFPQFDAALAARPDIILLDNMDPEQMREAVRRRNMVAPEVKLEASGGVSLDPVRAIAETGVDRISVGAITHSAPALDIALDYEPT